MKQPRTIPKTKAQRAAIVKLARETIDRLDRFARDASFVRFKPWGVVLVLGIHRRTFECLVRDGHIVLGQTYGGEPGDLLEVDRAWAEHVLEAVPS